MKMERTLNMMAAHSEPESNIRAGGDLAVGTLPETTEGTTSGRRTGTSERTTEGKSARRRNQRMEGRGATGARCRKRRPAGEEGHERGAPQTKDHTGRQGGRAGVEK